MLIWSQRDCSHPLPSPHGAGSESEGHGAQYCPSPLRSDEKKLPLASFWSDCAEASVALFQRACASNRNTTHSRTQETLRAEGKTQIAQGWPKSWARFRPAIGIRSPNAGPSRAIGPTRETHLERVARRARTGTGSTTPAEGSGSWGASPSRSVQNFSECRAGRAVISLQTTYASYFILHTSYLLYHFIIPLIICGASTSARLWLNSTPKLHAILGKKNRL